MEDRKDIDDLLSSLERLCLEHQWMKYSLDNIPEASHWRKEIRFWWKTEDGRPTGFAKRVSAQFGDARAAIQSAPPDARLVQLLKDALNKTTL